MMNQTDLSRVDLNLLVLFEAVMAERHVGRAADRLDLTSSAVSHGLGRLRRLFNDPLFLRTPKGVVPTARAAELGAPVADLLARARSVVASAGPFDPARSTRRFTIGAPDGVSAVFLPPLLEEMGRSAPGVDVSLRQLLPAPNEPLAERAWRGVFAALEERAFDVAVVPLGSVPARFHARALYDEDFVVASRAGHPFAERPTLESYCAARHLVVSLAGDPHGFVDEILAGRGVGRRVALTVPNFLFAITVVAETDLLAALPRRFAAVHAARFGVATVEAPLPLTTFRLSAVVPAAATMDRGIAWLLDLLGRRLGSGADGPPNVAAPA